MDANKLAELKRIGYTIPKTCGFCVHGDFVGTKDYGACVKHEYEHKKHTGPQRFLSIYRGGTCSKFEQSDAKVPYGRWAEFIT